MMTSSNSLQRREAGGLINRTVTIRTKARFRHPRTGKDGAIEVEGTSSHGDEVDALAAKKTAQTEAKETRNQHVILEKRKDSHFGRNPTDHQQF